MNKTVKPELLAVEVNSGAIDENTFHAEILVYLPNDRH